jgi:RecQ family ATP-dependent DNA helicase
MLWTDKAKKILEKYWGFSTLKDKQVEVINELLLGNDVIGLLPTGYGKSMCYLIPPLVTKKAIIIISPLISLMDDQKDKLIKMNIPVSALHGNNKNKDKEIFEIIDGKIKIIYMSPEYLIKGDGIELMDSLVQNKLIGFLAIDEAHCISVWGHDFRPEYMKIKSLREKYPQVPILAVTATATNKVAEEISVNLNLNNPSVILANFDRPNLYLKCINYGEYKQNTKIKEKKPRRKKGELPPEKDLTDISDEIDIELLKPYFEKYKNDKIIIYTNSRSTTVNLSDVINKIYKERISESYHAGMSKSLREQVQAKFANGDINIMVSTIAFGMGVDFVIRCVIIIGGSSSIEEYWQQIGRAGRDNLDAETIVFFQPQTIIIARSLLEKEYNKNSLIGLNKKNNLNSMQKYFYLSSCRRKFVLNHFNQPPKFFTCNKCDNCCEKELIDITSIIWSKEFNTKHPSHLENFQVEYVKEKLKPFQKNKSGMDSFYELKSDLINWKKYIIKKEFTYDTLPFNLRIRISLPNLPSKVVSNNSIDECERMLLL